MRLWVRLPLWHHEGALRQTNPSTVAVGINGAFRGRDFLLFRRTGTSKRWIHPLEHSIGHGGWGARWVVGMEGFEAETVLDFCVCCTCTCFYCLGGTYTSSSKTKLGRQRKVAGFFRMMCLIGVAGLQPTTVFILATARHAGCPLVTSDADFRGLDGVTCIA